MSAILHVHDTVLPNPQLPLKHELKLCAQVPFDRESHNKMNKWLGTRICEVFEGERHHGTVTEVIYHDLHAQYMFRGEYEDGDRADYWRHELEMLICRCTHITRTVDEE